MRYLVAILCFMLVGNVYADAIKVTVTNNDTSAVLEETVISEERVKAVEYYVYDFAKWIITAAKNKAELRTDAFVEELSDKNVRKLSKTQKKNEVKRINVKSRKEREND